MAGFDRLRAPVLIALVLLSTLSILPNQGLVVQDSSSGQGKLVFSDDFEGYRIGSFPSQGGWVIDYNGAGDSEQYVSDAFSYSGSKSLRLLGTNGWAAVVERYITYSSRIIGYDVKVYVPEYGSTEANAKVGFSHLHAGGPRWSGDAFYAWIWFTHEGYIIAQDGKGFKKVMRYQTNKWHDIKAIYDTVARNYTLWINGKKIGVFHVDPNEDPGKPNAINLQSCWAHVPVYFDDVKVFEITSSGGEENPAFKTVWRVRIHDNTPQFSVDVGDVDGDGMPDVVIIPQDWHSLAPGTNNTLQVIRSDGEELWSKSILIEGAVVGLADIDGDGKCEVIVAGTPTDGSSDAVVYAFDDNGKELWEFHGKDDTYGHIGWLVFTNLDTDPYPEIIAVNAGWESHSTYALDGNGELLWKFHGYENDHALLGDITGDGIDEIILLTNLGFRVQVLDKSGRLIWEYTSDSYNNVGVLGDVTGDENKDLVVCEVNNDWGDVNKLYVLRSNGSLYWLRQFTVGKNNGPTVPVLVDVNGDGVNDLVLGANKKVYALRNDGEVLWKSNETLHKSPQVLWYDINQDGRKEMIFEDNHQIYVVDEKGFISRVGALPDNGHLITRTGFTSVKQGQGILLSADIDHDGYKEIIISESINGKYYVAAIKPIIKGPSIGIYAPSVIPLNRLFNLNVSVTNSFDHEASVSVALVERTGFQAGPQYGDGDEIRNVVLNPHESRSLSFTARVYGVPRTSDKAVFKVYVNGELYRIIEENLNITPEFIRIPLIVFPTSVLKGGEFSVYVPLPYSFARPTRVDVTLENMVNGRVLEHTYTLSGNGIEVAVFSVDKAFSSIDRVGDKDFRIVINVRYPEEGCRIAYTLSKEFSVHVAEKAGSSLIIPTNIYFKLKLDGATYYAFLAYNASMSNARPPSESYYDAVNRRYSAQNWLIFKYTPNTPFPLSPVMNNTLYTRLALAAEVAMLRSTAWTKESLEETYKYFSYLEGLAREARGILWATRLMGLAAHMVIMGGLSADAPIALDGRTLLTAEQALKLYKALSFYEIFDKALKKASAPDELLYWLGVDTLTEGKDDVRDANGLLVNVKPSSAVDVAEALKFANEYTLGRSRGFAGIFILGTYMSDKWKAFREGILEIIGVNGAYEFYEALRHELGSPAFLEYTRYMQDAINRYNMWREAVMSHSIGFRDYYLNATGNSIRVSVMEPKGQHTILAEVIDDKGRKAGADPSRVKCEIPGSYILKYDEGISIIVPLNTTIEKVIIHSVNATKPVEKYNITISTYQYNEPKGSYKKSGEVKANTDKVYRVGIGEDLEPIINETTTTTSSAHPTFHDQQPQLVTLIAGLAITAALVATVIYLLLKRRAHT